MRAMILAAGLATRLLPLSRTIPKAGLPVLNRPLLYHALDWLGRFGVHEAAVNLHHLPETVRSIASRYDRSGWTLRFSEEFPEILLTAGALGPVQDFFRGQGTFVLVNGKIVTDIDLNEALAFHRGQGFAATLVTVPNPAGEPFSHVRSTPDHRFDGIESVKSALARGDTPSVFTGIHLLEPQVVDRIPPGRPYDTIRDLYPSLTAAGIPVGVYRADGLWLEFSTPERYLRNSLRLLSSPAATSPAAGGTEVRGERARWPEGALVPRRWTGPQGQEVHNAVLGPATELAAGAAIGDSILLGQNRVGAAARVEGCLLGPGVTVPPGARLCNVMMVKRADSPGAPPDAVPLANPVDAQRPQTEAGGGRP